MKRIKVIICCLFIFVFLSPVSYAYNEDFIVCVTKTGDCYHLDRCSYLKSCIELTLEQAVNAGYRPCSRCDPPTLSTENVRLNKYSTDHLLELEREENDELRTENIELSDSLRSLEKDVRNAEREYDELAYNIPKYCGISFLAGGVGALWLRVRFKKRSEPQHVRCEELQTFNKKDGRSWYVTGEGASNGAKSATAATSTATMPSIQRITTPTYPVSKGQCLYYRNKFTDALCYTVVESVDAYGFSVKYDGKSVKMPFSAYNTRLYVSADKIPLSLKAAKK